MTVNWSNVIRFLILGNKVSAFVSLALVVEFTLADQGDAAAVMVAAMLCSVMFVVKLEGIRKEL